MLSISAAPINAADYFLRISGEDYYLNGGEPEGIWVGKGANLLGLSEKVERQTLKNLLAGKTPGGSGWLVQVQEHADGRKRQCGWDLTFSAPKSVSALWSASDDSTRSEIQKSHFHAVKVAIGYLEENASYSRVGKGGLRQEKADLVIATFEHGTSRALDPQLHTHCLVINTCVRPDGSTGTLLSRPLYLHKMAAGALYRAELAKTLREKLGLVSVPKKTWFELKGVPDELCKEFSRRREAIEKELGSLGLESASAAAFAASSTRPPKSFIPPRSELFKTWQAIAAKHGLTSDAARALLHRSSAMKNDRGLKAASEKALEQLTTNMSHFAERDLIRAVAEAVQARGYGADAILERVRGLLSRPEKTIHLLGDGYNARYSTPQTIKREKELFSFVQRLAEKRGLRIGNALIEDVISRFSTPRSPIVEEARHHVKQLIRAARKQPTERIDRPKVSRHAKAVLSEEHKGAIRKILGSRGRIKVLDGISGAGKSFVMQACREAWEKKRHVVLGVSASGVSARRFEKMTGIKTESLQMLNHLMHPTLRFRLRHDAKQLLRAAQNKKTYKFTPLKITKGTVLVVDGAESLSTQELKLLASDISRGGGQLVLVGDKKQLSPWGAGTPFGAVSERVIAATLTESIRQDEPSKRVSKALRAGDPEEALRAINERGFLSVKPNKVEAIEALVSDWVKLSGKDPKQSMIICGTHEEVSELNRRCQEARALGGFVDPKRSARVGSGFVFVGDRVTVNNNSRALGLRNGDTGTITGLNGLLRRLTIKLDNGESATIPIRKIRAGRGAKRGQIGIELGYATTTHKARGNSVERAYVLFGGDETHLQSAYIQASVARKETRYYCDEKEAGPELRDLLRQLKTSRAKTLAHDVLEQRMH